jgi:type II secretory pathway pseudopilin PulG
LCNLLPLAGPIATIIAAVAAVVVTWRLGRQQLRIAQQQAAIAHQQAETALDRLRYDLFEKRYAIYDATRQLIRLTINDSPKPDFEIYQAMPLLIS